MFIVDNQRHKEQGTKTSSTKFLSRVLYQRRYRTFLISVEDYERGASNKSRILKMSKTPFIPYILIVIAYMGNIVILLFSRQPVSLRSHLYDVKFVIKTIS